MRKFFLITFAAVWLTAACALLPYHTSPPSPLRSLVVVTATIEGHPSLCTGIVVGVVDVLTARHCVPDDGDVKIDEVPERVLRQDGWFALIRAHAPLHAPVLSVRTTPLNSDETYITFGFGMGKLTIMQRYIILHDPDTHDIYMDGPLIPGMSGGPVVDEAGHLVGVNQMTYGVLGLASGPESIQAFLTTR